MKLAKVGLAAVVLACGAAAAQAQEKYPSRPIEFIVPWGPGGGADQVARKAAQLMEKDLGASLPVINVPGATGQTGLTKMLAAPADGYSMSIMTGDTFGLLTDASTKWSLKDITPAAIMTGPIFVREATTASRLASRNCCGAPSLRRASRRASSGAIPRDWSSRVSSSRWPSSSSSNSASSLRLWSIACSRDSRPLIARLPVPS